MKFVEPLPAPAAAAWIFAVSPGRADVRYCTRHVLRRALAIEVYTSARAVLFCAWWNVPPVSAASRSSAVGSYEGPAIAIG